MAVAAYASLVSLANVLHNVQYRAWFHLPCLDLQLIKTLLENVYYLLEFSEIHSQTNSRIIQGLWRQMAEVAFEVEDTINYHVVNQLNFRSQEADEADLIAFHEDLKKVIQKICFIKKELSDENEEEGKSVPSGKQLHAIVPAGDSSVTPSSGDNIAVGIDEHIVRLVDELSRRESDLQILPITGMGGIGKTTLARNAFNHPYIVENFDMRIWLTITQNYSVEQILKGLVDSGDIERKHGSLVELLYKKLFGRRYLIVMDDVWTIEAWNELRKAFPNNGNGSHIILTTRLSDIATCLGSHSPYPLTFLDDIKSWDLFCQTTFAQIGCPFAELEQIGKEIAKSCKGLPLGIVVIGRLLANSNMTSEYWKLIATNISAFRNLGDDEHCLKVLSLSYNDLPIYLKPCFLYLRVYPEDSQILVASLIDSWIIEGFIEVRNGQTLEETANDYLIELIDRNLISENKSDIRYCSIHDLLLELCIKESDNEHFVQYPRTQYVELSYGEGPFCFLCSDPVKDKEQVDIPKLVHIPGSLSSQVSPFICDNCEMLYSHITRPTIVHITRPTIVKATEESCHCLMKGITSPTELRYASIDHNVKFVHPPTFHLLWNLQFLAIHTCCYGNLLLLPPEIWEMPQLRKIYVPEGLLLPTVEPTPDMGKDSLVLNNLQSLSRVHDFKATKNILDRIPNLKLLSIWYMYSGEGYLKPYDHFLGNLLQLRKLQSLSVEGLDLTNITFPSSLKELDLQDCQMTWKDVSILGLLPSLEDLKLWQGFSMMGSEWNPSEGKFCQLKKLEIRSSDLVYWTADESHFPMLQRLELHVPSLKDIPTSIGDIPTLQSITLYYCSDSAVKSAKLIWEEQQDQANESLQIDVTDMNGVRYTIDTSNVNMSVAATASLTHLKDIPPVFGSLVFSLDNHQLQTNYMGMVEETVQFLRNFVEVHYQTENPAMESLRRELCDVAFEVHDFDLTRNLPQFVDNKLLVTERLIRKLHWIKEKLVMTDNQDGDKDAEARIESLRIQDEDDTES